MLFKPFSMLSSLKSMDKNATRWGTTCKIKTDTCNRLHTTSNSIKETRQKRRCCISIALATEKTKFAKMLQDEREKKGGSGGSSGNEALQKVVMGEYQKAMQKYQTSKRSVQEASLQIEQAERQKKAAELTLREVTGLDGKNTVFRSVGKACVLSSVKECIKRLEDESNDATDRSKSFVKKRESFARQMKTAENNIMEINKSFRRSA